MKQYVTLDKRSKKAQREYYAKQRTTWGELNPVTRSVPSGNNVYFEQDRKEGRCQNKINQRKVLRFVIAKRIAFWQELRYTIYKRRWSR